MERKNIETTIQMLNENGWKEEQIISALRLLTLSNPETLKSNFRNLIYFFSLLPLNESEEMNQTDLVDVSSAFTPSEFKELMFFANELQSSL